MRNNELFVKSREAMMSAVQIFNNPLITFKSETFITLAIISWTYLMHAYYKNHKISYQYYRMNGKKKIYDRTRHGAIKHWELERCLDCNECPLDNDTKNNLKFLIGIRHEIEHQMTKNIDDSISAKLQACAINYNFYVKKLFGENFGVDRDLGIALQFAPIQLEQKDNLLENEKLTSNIKKFIVGYEDSISENNLNNPHYAYRVCFVKLNVNKKGQADKVINFIPEDSPIAATLNKEYAVTKEVEKKKYYPKDIVNYMNEKGYYYFKMNDFTDFWKNINSDRDKLKQAGYGVFIANKQWLWYEKMLQEVEKYCMSKEEIFKYNTNCGNKKRCFTIKEIRECVRKQGLVDPKPSEIKQWLNANNYKEGDTKQDVYNIKNEWIWNEKILNKFMDYWRNN